MTEKEFETIADYFGNKLNESVQKARRGEYVATLGAVATFMEKFKPLVKDDWHEYPADPPEKSGAYLVAFKGINGDIYRNMAYYHKDCGFEGEPINEVIAWMPLPEYQPKDTTL